MELEAGDEDLARTLSSESRRRRAFGSDVSVALRYRLGELRAVERFSDAWETTGLYRDLGTSDGRVRIELTSRWSMVVRPTEQPPPLDGDGRLDLNSISALVVLAVDPFAEGGWNE